MKLKIERRTLRHHELLTELQIFSCCTLMSHIESPDSRHHSDCRDRCTTSKKLVSSYPAPLVHCRHDALQGLCIPGTEYTEYNTRRPHRPHLQPLTQQTHREKLSLEHLQSVCLVEVKCLMKIIKEIIKVDYFHQ